MIAVKLNSTIIILGLHSKILIITLKHKNLEYILFIRIRINTYYLSELKYSSIEQNELERRNLFKVDLKTCISFAALFM